MTDKPEQITVDKAKAIKGLGVEYPSTAPVPIEEAVAHQEKVDAAVQKSSDARSKRNAGSLARRVAVLEHAVGGQGIDLARIDAQELGLTIDDSSASKSKAKSKPKAKAKKRSKAKSKSSAASSSSGSTTSGSTASSGGSSWGRK